MRGKTLKRNYENVFVSFTPGKINSSKCWYTYKEKIGKGNTGRVKCSAILMITRQTDTERFIAHSYLLLSLSLVGYFSFSSLHFLLSCQVVVLDGFQVFIQFVHQGDACNGWNHERSSGHWNKNTTVCRGLKQKSPQWAETVQNSTT